MGERTPDYYETLGVPRDATQAQIRKAFLQLARKWHPDLNKEPGAEERFKGINEAYEVLGDEEKRKAYDAYGSGARGGTWQGADGQPYQWSATSTWEDIMNLFRNRRGAQGGQQAASQDFGDIFDDVFFSNLGTEPGGSSFNAAFNRNGQAAGGQWDRGALDMEATLPVPLSILLSGGTRRVSVDDVTVNVKINKGTRPGTELRLRGMGRERNGIKGDLYVTLDADVPAGTYIDGNDIHSDITIPFQTALLGGEMVMPLPDGTHIKVQVPPGTSTGKRFSVRGHGFDGDSRCLLHTKVSVPQAVSQSFRDGLRKLCEDEGLSISE